MAVERVVQERPSCKPNASMGAISQWPRVVVVADAAAMVVARTDIHRV